MLKYVGSVIAGGLLGGLVVSNSPDAPAYLPVVVAGVGFIGALSVLSSLETPTPAPAPVAVAADTSSSSSSSSASKGNKKKGKGEKKPFVRREEPVSAAAAAIAAAQAAAVVAAAAPVAAAPTDGSEADASEAEEETKAAAPKKKGKKGKKKPAAAAAAAAAAPKEEKKSEEKTAEEKKAAKKKAAKAKKAAETKEEKKVEKKEETKEEKKVKKGGEEKKKAPKAEKKVEKKEEKAKKGERKVEKKEETKSAKKKRAEEKRQEEEDDAETAAAEADGWTVLKSARTKSTSSKKEEDLTEEELNKPVTQEIRVSTKSHGAILGNGGETLRVLQESTGARVTVPKKDSGSETVVIAGPLKSVLQAKKLIKEIESKGYSAVTHPGYSSTDIILKEKSQKGLLIGPKGAHIHAIQTATGARITMPAAETVSLKVSLSGSTESVKRAKRAIEELLAEGYSQLTHPSFVKLEIPFPREQLRSLIGTKGHTIKHITKFSRCHRINIPAADAPQNVVVIGTAETVLVAQKEITRLLAPVEDEAPTAEWVGEASPENHEDSLWD